MKNCKGFELKDLEKLQSLIWSCQVFESSDGDVTHDAGRDTQKDMWCRVADWRDGACTALVLATAFAFALCACTFAL